MHRSLRLLLLVLTSLTVSLPASAVELKPLKAVYTAQFDVGLTLQGKAVWHLQPLADQRWQISLQADTLLASIHESSRFRQQADQLQPLDYRYRREVAGKKRRHQAQFDWDNHTISSDKTSEPTPFPVGPPVYDKVSYQVALWHDVMAGNQPLAYQVWDDGRLKTYQFRVVGEETLSTPGGRYHTRIVERDRGEDSDRHTRIWLATEVEFLIVKLLQVEDGKEYELLLDQVQHNP